LIFILTDKVNTLCGELNKIIGEPTMDFKKIGMIVVIVVVVVYGMMQVDSVREMLGLPAKTA